MIGLLVNNDLENISGHLAGRITANHGDHQPWYRVDAEAWTRYLQIAVLNLFCTWTRSAKLLSYRKHYLMVGNPAWYTRGRLPISRRAILAELVIGLINSLTSLYGSHDGSVGTVASLRTKHQRQCLSIASFTKTRDVAMTVQTIRRKAASVNKLTYIYDIQRSLMGN
jgi:hypothetical protein